MKIMLSWRRHHYVARVGIFLIVVALIAGMVGCGGGDGDGGGGGDDGNGNGVIEYDLTIASTAGGLVTTPGEGTFIYDASTVVNLVATPDAGCRFVSWTGDVGTIANVNAATTTITMNGDYTITANFALGKLIAGVPDTSWPPTQTIPSTVSQDNYCAPLAMVNVLEYWDVVMGYTNAQGVTAGLPANTAAEYLGYFMDTNSNGSLNRGNGNDGHFGTYAKDISPGTLDFVRWDAGNLLGTPPPALPAGKIGYVWTVTDDFGWVAPTGFDFYKAEIDKDLPLVVCFRYWNPDPTGIQKIDPVTGETIDVFRWGDALNHSWEEHDYDNPWEEWDCPESEYGREDCIGHAVTGVGYILNWDPDGDDKSDDYVIVHDNWGDTTPRNVAIPWDNWNSSHAVDPAVVPPGNPLVKYDLTINSDMFGSVTTPGEGTFTCDVNAVVNLEATPGDDCSFVNWTGDVGTIADVNAAITTIAMNDDYSITANFFWSPVGPPV
jgi:hypothetical protein